MTPHRIFLDFARKEFLSVLPPTIYFLISFHIILFNTQLILSEFGIDLGAFVTVTVLALIVGKVVIVVDKLPFIRRLDTKPLVIPILFKASVFTFFDFLFRLLEPWIPALIKTGSLSAANQHLLEHYVWLFFTAAQIWIFICFVAYITVTELFTVFGFSRRQLLAAFFHEHPGRMNPS